tara:strand:- start:1223 stop:1510 length:288 start_codon:yes stop_codon:yes gene_type:complete
MLKSGEKRKDLFKKGDFVVWRHWQVDYGRALLHGREEILIEDRGVVLEITKQHRSNILHDGSRFLGRGPIDVWKAVVLFTSGTRSELPLVCLEKL